MRSIEILNILLLIGLSCCSSFTLVTSNTDKHGKVLSQQTCNKDSVIDFSFSPNTFMTCSSTCTTTNPTASTLNFLDVNGNDLSLALILATTTASVLVDSYTGVTNSFLFKFTQNSRVVYVVIPYATTIATTYPLLDIQLVASKAGSAFTQLGAITSASLATGSPINVFNYLNQKDYGAFYHATSPDATRTILISTKILYLPAMSSSTPGTFDITAEPGYTQLSTNLDLLCWASSSAGLFQTHIRESIPLWYSWLGVLLFWIYVLISEENNPNCFDHHFKDNNWTSWSIYSIFFLSNQNYFTKLSRTSVVLVNAIWQGCILSAIYSTQGPSSDSSIIIWAALVALVASYPIPYLLGHFFLCKIYALDIESMKVKFEMRSTLDKAKHASLESKTYQLESRTYGLYYGYYTIVMGSFILLSTISVHLMQQVSRAYYFQQYYWLASISIVLGLDHFIFDPLFTWLFGQTSFYRSRGYYFDFQLTQCYKQVA